MKIFLLNGRKVWLDPETAPAEAIPLRKPAKKVAAETTPEPEPKAKQAPASKAKKAPANKARKAGSNK